jgi:hypothetical protein
MSEPHVNFLGRVGQQVNRVYPHVDRDVWLMRRRLSTRDPQRSLDRFASGLDWSHPRSQDDPHLVVVVHVGPEVPNWMIAGGNHFFEVHQSAIELLGADRVTLFGVGAEEPTEDWQRRLVQTVAQTRATHMICQPEVDPNQHSLWNWDIVLPVLTKHWGGSTIGLMYDTAYEWIRIRAHRLGRQTRNLVLAELCQPMTGFVRRGQYEVGPMTMPLSQASVDAIDSYVAGMPKDYDVSFIGALYDYRIELLDRLAATGLRVAVNPHRTDVTHTFDESRTNQPTYLDYMAGLARSELTINFSLAHGGPWEQYKIRVHEASLVGCICLTDDGDRSRHFFAPNEYQFFPTVEALPEVVTARLQDRQALAVDQEDASRRAHALSRTDFWGRIELGLQRRGLPPLTRVMPPTEPDGRPVP